jgi:hypothetical protein
MSWLFYRVCIGVLASAVLGSETMTCDSLTFTETSQLTGTYEFLSEVTALTKPDNAKITRLAPEWGGLWQFYDGHYSRVLMKRKRDKFFDAKGVGDLEFEASAGSYRPTTNGILLTEDYTLHPFDVGRSRRVSCRLDGNTLTIIRRVEPGVEDLREGTVTTILRRISN